MSQAVPVYEGDKLVGFFDPTRAIQLGGAGSTSFEVEECGCGAWTDLLRLPNDVFVLVERTWDEFQGHCDGRAQRICRAEAIQWLLDNGIRLPDDLMEEAGLIDFTKDAEAVAPPIDAQVEALIQLLGDHKDLRPASGLVTDRTDANQGNDQRAWLAGPESGGEKQPVLEGTVPGFRAPESVQKGQQVDVTGHDGNGDQTPPVKLAGPGDCPIVRGKAKPLLTKAQYDVVKALLDAGERGLTKDELDRKSKHGDARKILKRLARVDADWTSVIRFPAKTGVGYRIG